MGMKTPEMKQSGRMMARMTGWAASASLTIEATAKPRQLKTTAPTMTVEEKRRARSAGDVGSEPGPTNGEQDRGEHQCGQAGHRRSSGDDCARRDGRRPATLVDARLPVTDDRRHQVRERRGDDTVGDDARHIIDRTR